MFNPASFIAPPDSRCPFVNYAWGTGHTLETDPTRKGWRCRPNQPGSICALLGRPGTVGCASVIYIRDGELDVALYLETPKVAHEAINGGRAHLLDPFYFQVPDLPGWGLKVINRIEEDLAP